MQIAKHKVVTIDYTLTDKQGTILDSSQGGEPLSYIQGTGSLVPGLETALEGKSTGDQLTVSLPPDQGYGERDESLDGNHPLAGVTLNFDVTVVDVRDATAEELSHGHAHAPGAHDH